jgi:hypothetical protein
MRRILIAILFVVAAISLSGQARNFTYRGTGSTPAPSAREIVHYLFENNTDDESGNEYSFTNNGGSFETTPSPEEGTYHWASTSSTGEYITINSTLTSSWPSDFSISARAYFTTEGTNLRWITTGTQGSTGFTVRVNTTGQDMDVFTNSTESSFNNYFSSSPSTNAYRTFGVSYESSSGTVRFYVDGVEHGSSPSTGASGVTLTGAWYLFNNVNGYIDDFRVYDELLTEANFLWIHNNAGDPLPED